MVVTHNHPSTPMPPLAAAIAGLCPQDGSHPTALPGLYLTRASKTDCPRNTLDRAVFCVVAQGSKSTLLQDRRHIYDCSKYLLVSLDLPLVGQIEEASRARPFLGCSLVLDFTEINALLLETGMAREPRGPVPSGMAIGSLDEDLLSAVTRLVQLLRKPAQIPVLAPLIRREIYYRLLLGDGGSMLRHLSAEDGRLARIATGLDWLRRNAARAIRMQELARELHMSPSAMHSWFRSVTSMSPLQFQKQLRLQEARRIMLAECLDAGTASRRVGYESASQFSREYRRLFGSPPMRDIDGLRALGSHRLLNKAAEHPSA